MAKGFSQEYRVDHKETFASVARMTFVLVAFSLQWLVFRTDVKNAFLNSDISKEVYMRPSPGLEYPQGHVCHFRRALYGLK